jgi:RNA polymerase sigma-70 factor, ECF subfamily
MTDPGLSFEPHRRRLPGLAYRMLGSIAEAEDAVQDAYLRWHGADRDKVTDPRAFLTTAMTRNSLDVLRSARARREEYVGPWLPEPVVDTKALAPDAQTELAECARAISHRAAREETCACARRRFDGDSRD